MAIEPEQFYTDTAPELTALAKSQTWAVWRTKGKGPAVHKIGSRVYYKGADVLAWLEAQRVEPQSA